METKDILLSHVNNYIKGMAIYEEKVNWMRY